MIFYYTASFVGPDFHAGVIWSVSTTKQQQANGVLCQLGQPVIAFDCCHRRRSGSIEGRCRCFLSRLYPRSDATGLKVFQATNLSKWEAPPFFIHFWQHLEQHWKPMIDFCHKNLSKFSLSNTENELNICQMVDSLISGLVLIISARMLRGETVASRSIVGRVQDDSPHHFGLDLLQSMSVCQQ